MILYQIDNIKNQFSDASPKRCFPTYYVDLGTVQEFSLLGEEKFHLMLEHFRKTKKIELEFYNVLFISETYWAKSTVGFKTGTDQNINSYLKTMLEYALPHISVLNFIRAEFFQQSNSEAFSNFLFDFLSKNTKQKALEIVRLDKINDVAITALANMIKKGVSIGLSYPNTDILPFLPECHFHYLRLNDELVRKLVSCFFVELIIFWCLAWCEKPEIHFSTTHILYRY